MTGPVPVESVLVPYARLEASRPASEALEALRLGGSRPGIVEDAGRPQALIVERDLAIVADLADRPLREVLHRLPPLLVLDGRATLLDTVELRELASLLAATGAAGLVVAEADEVVGVIPRSAVARALPLEAIGAGQTRFYGDITVPVRTFVCRKCPPPSPRRRPRAGDATPACPRDRAHGAMDRESGPS